MPEKANARAGVSAYAPKIAGDRVWVRVNGLDTGLAEADLDAVIGVEGLAGLFLPKVETREEVLRWDSMVAALERARGVEAGATQLVLSIESALGVLNAYDHGDRGRGASLRSPSAARRMAISTPTSAALGRATGRK